KSGCVMNRSIGVGVVLGVLVIVLPARGQEWTRFRGPNGSGISGTRFSEAITEGQFLWKVQLPGIGHSSPVIWQDRVYVTAADPASAKRVILCINSADGGVFWQKQFSSVPFQQHNDNSYASST